MVAGLGSLNNIRKKEKEWRLSGLWSLVASWGLVCGNLIRPRVFKGIFSQGWGEVDWPGVGTGGILERGIALSSFYLGPPSPSFQCPFENNPCLDLIGPEAKISLC